MFRIDDRLREFMEAGVSAIVGTGDASGRPHVAFGWAPRVAPDAITVDFFLDAPRAGQALADLAENPRVALTVTDPVSYRSIQLKGAFVRSDEPTEADLAWVQRHRDAFLVTTSLIGDPPALIAAMWMDEVVRLTFTVERAFDQTPGPLAGAPL